MTRAERWRKWFDNFGHHYPRIRLERRRRELQARHEEGRDEYLSGKPARLPLPRFRVLVSDSCTATSKPRRPHRRTNKPPTGRPVYDWDVYLAAKVLEILQNED